MWRSVPQFAKIHLPWKPIVKYLMTTRNFICKDEYVFSTNGNYFDVTATAGLDDW
jgi:hypothetical protein